MKFKSFILTITFFLGAYFIECLFFSLERLYILVYRVNIKVIEYGSVVYNIKIDASFLYRALNRERVVYDKLRENLDRECRSLLQSTDRENSFFEDIHFKLVHAKLKDLKNSVERENQRLQSQVTFPVSQVSVRKD